MRLCAVGSGSGFGTGVATREPEHARMFQAYETEKLDGHGERPISSYRSYFLFVERAARTCYHGTRGKGMIRAWPLSHGRLKVGSADASVSFPLADTGSRTLLCPRMNRFHPAFQSHSRHRTCTATNLLPLLSRCSTQLRPIGKEALEALFFSPLILFFGFLSSVLYSWPPSPNVFTPIKKLSPPSSSIVPQRTLH